jgi:hypothetical protein
VAACYLNGGLDVDSCIAEFDAAIAATCSSDESTNAPGDESTTSTTRVFSDACVLLQSSANASVALCYSLGGDVDSCIENLNDAIAVACLPRRVRRADPACDHAALKQALEEAQIEYDEAESTKQALANDRIKDSASSIASAMIVVAVGLASALY